MTIIALPMWTFTALLLIPCLCLLYVAVKLYRLRRNLSGRPSVPTQNLDWDKRFQKDLYALQIDAVFNALIALVETERIKLKTLVCHNYPAPLEAPADDAFADDTFVDDAIVAPAQEPNKASGTESFPAIIAERKALGESLDDIAQDMNISQNEIELAMSLHHSHGDEPHKRLEAVA